MYYQDATLKMNIKGKSRDTMYLPLLHLHNLYRILPYVKGIVVTVFGAAKKISAKGLLSLIIVLLN